MLRKLGLLLAALTLSAPAFAQGIETAAKQAIVLDYETGTVLLEKNSDERMPTSSMSKVMTAYMVFDALKKGQISLDQEFPVSERAWNMQGSKMFVELGKQIKVEDLLRGVIIQSGNDATIVLAEGIAGTEDTFAKNMTEKAKELGMENSNFMNASGWPDDNHYSTARDLSTLAVHLIRDFPEYYKYYSEKEFTYHAIKQGNRNPLLYLNIGADGVKTGHTEAAGYGLIGSGVSPVNGRRVVFVMNGLESMEQRSTEGAKLLDWGLKNFQNVKLLKEGDTVGNVNVAKGTVPSIPLVVKDSLAVTIPAAATSNYKVTANYKEPLIAPIAQGAEVGTITVEVPNAEKMTFPLYAGGSSEKLGFVPGIVDKAKRLFAGS